MYHIIVVCKNCFIEFRGSKKYHRQFCCKECKDSFIKGKTYEEMYSVDKGSEIKLKQRLSLIKIITSRVGQMFPGYNPKGCQLFEQTMKASGSFIQHAENGGEYHIKELGYWVDGYDEKNNIVYEYDEKYHETQIEKDKQRQKEIIDYLNSIGHVKLCQFIRIKENEI